MAASVNKVILIGNLTRDPELRFTPKGQGLCEIGLAVNRKYKLDSGETREEVTFVDVTFWGKPAEIVSKWMKKGNPMYIEGRLQLDSWEDKTTGQKRSKLRVVAEEFQFLGGDKPRADADGSYEEDRTNSPARPAPARPAAAPQAAPHNDEGGPSSIDEDDIPF